MPSPVNEGILYNSFEEGLVTLNQFIQNLSCVNVVPASCPEPILVWKYSNSSLGLCTSKRADK